VGRTEGDNVGLFVHEVAVGVAKGHGRRARNDALKRQSGFQVHLGIEYHRAHN